MKTLHLIRHAKSSWDFPRLSDFERPLNARGLKSCRRMAPTIEQHACLSNVFASTAKRVQLTLININEHLTNGPIHWQTEGELYTFNWRTLLSWCQQLDEQLSEVTIVGHNPALTELCLYLTDTSLDNLPTCGYAKLALNIDHWQALSYQCGQLSYLMTPKLVKQASSPPVDN